MIAIALIVILIILLLYCLTIEPYMDLKVPVRTWDLEDSSIRRKYPVTYFAKQNYVGL